MIEYTFPVSGIVPSFNLWRFIGPAPADIDINSPIGVTGIQAQLPSNNAMILQFFDAGANDLFGRFIFFDGVTHWECGLENNAGILALELGGENITTGVKSKLSMAGNSATDTQETNTFRYSFIKSAVLAFDSIVDKITGAFTIRQISPTAISSNVKETSSNNEAEFFQSKSVIILRIKVAAVEKCNFSVTQNGISLNVGISPKFQVFPTGEIKTNQITAGVPVGIVNGYLSITDISGGVVKIPCII